MENASTILEARFLVIIYSTHVAFFIFKVYFKLLVSEWDQQLVLTTYRRLAGNNIYFSIVSILVDCGNAFRTKGHTESYIMFEILVTCKQLSFYISNAIYNCCRIYQSKMMCSQGRKKDVMFVCLSISQLLGCRKPHCAHFSEKQMHLIIYTKRMLLRTRFRNTRASMRFQTIENVSFLWNFLILKNLKPSG